MPTPGARHCTPQVSCLRPTPQLFEVPTVVLQNKDYIDCLCSLLEKIHDYTRVCPKVMSGMELLRTMWSILVQIPTLQSIEMDVASLTADWEQVINPATPFRTHLFLNAIQDLESRGLSSVIKHPSLEDWTVTKWKEDFVRSGAMKQLFQVLRSDSFICSACPCSQTVLQGCDAAVSACPIAPWHRSWEQVMPLFVVRIFMSMAVIPANPCGPSADEDLPDTEPYDVDTEGTTEVKEVSMTDAQAMELEPQSTPRGLHPRALELLESDVQATVLHLLCSIELLSCHVVESTDRIVKELVELLKTWASCEPPLLLSWFSSLPNLHNCLWQVLVHCPSSTIKEAVLELVLKSLKNVAEADQNTDRKVERNILMLVSCLLEHIEKGLATPKGNDYVDLVRDVLQQCLRDRQRSVLSQDKVVSLLKRLLENLHNSSASLDGRLSNESSAMNTASFCVHLSQHCADSDLLSGYHRELAHVLFSALFGTAGLTKEDGTVCDHADVLGVLWANNFDQSEKSMPEAQWEPSSTCLVKEGLQRTCSLQQRNIAFQALTVLGQKSPQLVPLCLKHVSNYFNPYAGQNFPWRYNPGEERRVASYSGLVNLGATCYMASSLQQLFMVPELGEALMTADILESAPHAKMLQELQLLFVRLAFGEWRALSPENLGKVYQMCGAALNLHEQTDMAEFFIDLVGKIEEGSPSLAKSIDAICRGTFCQSIVSRDCTHVSLREDPFFLVRCPVEGVTTLEKSLSSTVEPDALEGDNKYVCSKCPEGSERVAADKRTSFRHLPPVLCLNIQRYVYNVMLMQREKVNSLLEFPEKLNMYEYTEQHLLKDQSEKAANESGVNGDSVEQPMNEGNEEGEPCYDYELVGVTVHTGTAEGGHYYSYIRDRYQPPDQEAVWYSFNDTDVRVFDTNKLAAECFGGQMPVQGNRPAVEKSNSAYMLVYERVDILSRRRTTPRSELCARVRADLMRKVVVSNLLLEHHSHIFDCSFFDYTRQLCVAGLELVQSVSTFGPFCFKLSL